MKDTKIPTLCEKGAVSHLEGSSFCYQGWPTVCRDEEGTLYAAASSFRCAHVCPFGKNAMFISKNGGKTWSPPIVVNDTYSDDRDAGLLYMGEGRLLLSHFHHPATYYESNKDSLLTWAGSDEIKKGFAGVIEGLASLPEEARQAGSFVRLSEDYGITWSENIRVPVTAPHGPCLCPDGSLLYLGKGSFSREEDGIDKDEIWAYASLDGGKTWEKRGLCQKPADISWRVLHEPHALALPDGSLLGAIRSEAGSTGGGCFATFITKSYDGGRTWSAWRDLGVIGSPPHLLLLSTGEVLCSYGRREKPYGIRAIFSADGGESWGDEYILDEDFETYDLGYPSTAELDDGSLITVYYGHHGGPKPNDVLYTKWKR
ncbi:MAG: exo-alpha-sialidase [Clostridia bacterium]|nr:exo-alpha-sialidase [Clostridia bacterium]